MMSDCFAGFRPHPVFSGGHAQTLMAAYARTGSYKYRATQHTVPLDDGDAVVLHDDRPPVWRPRDRVVLLIHGLTGCHGSPYLVRTSDKLVERGVRTFRVDLRGSGASQPISSRPGHAGRSEDVRAAVQQIIQLCPGSRIAVAGFSLGGNLLLKMLGESPAEVPAVLDHALAVAPPIDLAACAAGLRSGLARLYGRSFTKRLHVMLQTRQDLLAELPELGARRPRDLFDFDDRITAPLSGFENAKEYYERCSSAPLLPKITVPTVIVAASDDPLIPASMLRDAPRSATVELVLTEGGGHVGFLGRRGRDPDRWWLDWRVVDWVQQLDPKRVEPLEIEKPIS